MKYTIATLIVVTPMLTVCRNEEPRIVFGSAAQYITEPI